MNTLDLVVLCGTLIFIVAYGVYKSSGQGNIESYLRGGNSMKWGTIGLSVMATQASAITFISTPGQAYESGLGFVQNYFGLPLALIVVSVVFIPIFYKLKVYTAYEYLESRFDAKTRYLGAAIFLIQRGLAAGITIYAPAIIISSVLHWNLNYTVIGTGLLVIAYTVAGGTKAVSITQKQQMAVIMAGMFIAFAIIIGYINQYASFGEALTMAGSLGKLNAVSLSLDPSQRYTVWSGITGGFFLALSYFGTDQSQVQRYLGGVNTSESRTGLMFNALLKIPMQFFILFTGVMVYVFYVFNSPPLHFKEASVAVVQNSAYAEEYQKIEQEYQKILQVRKEAASSYGKGQITEEEKTAQLEVFKKADAAILSLREDAKGLILKADESLKTKDSDYVFLTFILTYLPHGLVGLLIAVIFSAAMSSTSSELNALASTSSVDFYRRAVVKNASENHYLGASKLLTLGWGAIAIVFALLANNSENLIEAVNIIGSIFYGTILGIFLVAFFIKWVNGSAVFFAAIVAQLAVIVIHILTEMDYLELSYLWYNVIGCGTTMLLSMIIQPSLEK